MTLQWLAIVVIHHTMLVISIAHMYQCKWYAQLAKTHSNQKSVSKHATAWLQTHLLVEHVPTSITESLEWTTSTLSNLLDNNNNKKRRNLGGLIPPFFYD